MKNDYPEGAQLQQFIKRRRHMGVFWRSLFLLATTLGVLVLMVLLLTIINDSFGYVAIQYKIEPETLLLQHHKNRVLEAPLTETSEDVDFLAEQISKETRAVGFLGFADYNAHADSLRIAPIDGIAPDAESIAPEGIVIVVSQKNSWVDDLSLSEVQHLFTDAQTWSDVRSGWPEQPVIRFIPGRDSGVLNIFVNRIYGDDLSAQSNETLIALLETHVSKGVLRRFEKEQPLNTRSHEELYQLVVERVLKPTILETWSLYDSIFHRAQIQAFLEQEPRAKLEFRRWVTWDFITSRQSSRPEFAGVRTAILGSLWVVLITLLFSVPVGVGAAIYLEEYGSGNWLDQLIENNINNLAGVPSIIYGMLGLAVFVRALEPLTSGALFGLTDPTTANGRTILAAGLTLGLLILPIIIINAREAIRAVPRAFREASYALGATKWQTIWYHVLPNAIPGILTGSILAISRAFGETAPLVVIGASTAIFVDPSGPFSKFTTLPIQIYQWTARPQAAFQNLAAAAIIVLLILLLALNAAAVLLRNKYQRSY